MTNLETLLNNLICAEWKAFIISRGNTENIDKMLLYIEGVLTTLRSLNKDHIMCGELPLEAIEELEYLWRFVSCLDID